MGGVEGVVDVADAGKNANSREIYAIARSLILSAEKKFMAGAIFGP